MNLTKRLNQDFNRNIYYILGLPFDALSFEESLNFIKESVQKNRQIFLSTSNINWLVTALKDTFFKQAVMQSELNVIDGKPLFWIARFLGFPTKETVAGSSLIQYLHSFKNKIPYSIFWFGGEKGIAEKAAMKTNMHSYLKLAGYNNPGFGSVKELSSKEAINKINKSNPDLLLLTLGAKKGVTWINYNKDKLKASVISHVGATMNFIAGDIKRAPKWIQKIGLEWLWRIKEEPKLWKRYFNDGLFLIKLLIKYILPYKMFLIKNRKYLCKKRESKIILEENKEKIIIFIDGVCNQFNSKNIRNCFKEIIKKKKNILIDFSRTEFVDNSFLGLLNLLNKHQTINKKELKFKNLNKHLKRIFKLNLLNNRVFINKYLNSEQYETKIN